MNEDTPAVDTAKTETPAAEAAKVDETFYNDETEEQLKARGLSKTGALLGTRDPE